MLLSTLQLEKDFVQRLYDVLTELSNGMEYLAKKLAWNVSFMESSVSDPLQQKPAIDERDDFLQSLKEFMYAALKGKESIQKAGSVEELIGQMKMFDKYAENLLKGEKVKAAMSELEAIHKLEDEYISKCIEQVKAGECHVECDIVQKKLTELIEKKELLSKMIKGIIEEFTRAKANDIYKDGKTGMSINDIFIDFLLCQCEHVDMRIEELKANNTGKE